MREASSILKSAERLAGCEECPAQLLKRLVGLSGPWLYLASLTVCGTLGSCDDKVTYG